jgi:drug/metabolite transporter (DMT)-like permease
MPPFVPVSDQQTPVTLPGVQTAALAAALGVVAYVIIDATPWFATRGVPQGAVQFIWLLFVMAASGLCGWLHPRSSWRWAALLLSTQPLVMLLITLIRGEPDDSPATIPARTSVFIASVFVATVSPFALIAAAAMASKRRNDAR